MPGPAPYALNPDDVKETWDNLLMAAADRGITYEDIMTATADDHTMAWMSWLRCALLPEDNIQTPLRYHDQGSNIPTAAIGMRTPYAVNWQQQPVNAYGGKAGVNEQLGPSDMAIFSFDYSPLHILSIYDPNPNYSTVAYDWTWNGQTIVYFNPDNGHLIVNKAKSQEGVNIYKAHGAWLYCKKDNLNNRYFWLDVIPTAVNQAGQLRPSNITIVLNHTQDTSGQAPLYKVWLYRYNNGDPKPVETSTVSQNTVEGPPGKVTISFDLTRAAYNPATQLWNEQSDYYCISVQRLANDGPELQQMDQELNGGATVTQSSVCSVLRHLAMYEIEVLLNLMSSKCRILAQGVRITDVAMLQYVNGQIVGATAWDSYTWYEYFLMGLQGGRSFFDAAAQIPGAIPGDLWDGGYIYHKATQATDFAWRDTMSWDPNLKQPDDVYVPIETNRPVKIIACTAANDNTTGNPTGGGAACYITVATMLEYVPPVSIVETRMSEWSREACAAGADALGYFPDFTSNDKHWSEFATEAFRLAGAPILHAAINSGSKWLASKFPKAETPIKYIASAGHGAVDAITKQIDRRRKGRR